MNTKNVYFSIGATLRQLLRRMQEYSRMTLPPEYERLRFDAEPPVSTWPGDGLGWKGTFYAVPVVEQDVPFFEMGVHEENGVCRVRVRCSDPRAVEWVREMIVWLAPDRASDAVHPLPDLPSPAPVGTPTPAPSLEPAPTPTPWRAHAVGTSAPAPEGSELPRVPKRGEDRRRWRAIWKKAKPLVAEGKSVAYIVRWFEEHDDHLRPQDKVVRKVIKAGLAGLLD